MKEKIKEEIRKLLVDGKLPCKEAHELAERLRVDLLEIGQVANELKIKINRCQLGCF
ncbi:MAG: hypothetical protein HYY20_09210 [Candidatus Tectomicrobia bacterium]|uniref:Uncharacterized protein n=1 Tax=Tectimicrobiota bacterium TaxID=2528274 RepID=A0A932CPB9_UNCTE|nr:hypothetical protein [Candidatus Tectomicrobia bacterium]